MLRAKDSSDLPNENITQDELLELPNVKIDNVDFKLTALNNKHPMIPLPTAGAAFRLLLHGFSTEVLHGMLVQEKVKAKKPELT